MVLATVVVAAAMLAMVPMRCDDTHLVVLLLCWSCEMFVRAIFYMSLTHSYMWVVGITYTSVVVVGMVLPTSTYCSPTRFKSLCILFVG